MKPIKLMEERIRRVKVLFKELGYRLIDNELLEDSFMAGIENDKGPQGNVLIDKKSRFMEISFSFFFSKSMADFLRKRIEEMLCICYEYGCYTNIEKSKSEICFSVFDKIYYAGLNFYSLKHCLADFSLCVQSLTEVLEILKNKEL